MTTHKKILEALEVNVSDIKKGMTKLFGNPSQSMMNKPLSGTKGESRRFNSPHRTNKLMFMRYVDDDPMEWLNRVAHYFKYYEVP